MRLLTVLALALALPSRAEAGSDKVTICHLTSSATNPYNIISVSTSALSAHAKHGDFSPFAVYADADGDGYGNAASTVSGVCAVPSGYVTDSTDCDDAVASTNPGATESEYNGADDDCDASTPDDDLDGDGYVLDDDCDDTNAAVNPGALESEYNGIDDDCDAGTPDDDLDGDGFVLDEDCDDGNADVNPGATEVCNDVDDDCDGDADGGAVDASTWYGDTDGDGFGDAGDAADACDQPSGYVADDTDCDDADPAVNPGAVEVCNGVDDDCNGLADDDATDASTWYADADGDGHGDGGDAADACEAPAGYVADPSDCDDTDAGVNPSADEVCNGVDDNCDGDVDGAAVDASTWYADADADGYGDADETADACEAPAGYVGDDTDCDDTDADVNPGAAEVEGNDVDDDCDEDTPDDTAIVWNAADDYDGSNPTADGAWSYGHFAGSATTVSAITLSPTHGTSGILDFFHHGPFFSNMVYKNTSATTVFGNCADWCLQPGTLALHPDNSGRTMVARFTAPVTGTYDIDATFTPIDRQSNSIAVGIRRNLSVLHAGTLTTHGTSSSYSGTLALTAGDKIDFMVHRNDTWINDGTDIDATITLY